MQIDSYCRTTGLVIAGYYQASDLIGDVRYIMSWRRYQTISSTITNSLHSVSSPDLVSQKIMEKIAEYFPNACLVLINNSQISRQMSKPAISVTQYTPDGRWKTKEKERCT